MQLTAIVVAAITLGQTPTLAPPPAANQAEVPRVLAPVQGELRPIPASGGQVIEPARAPIGEAINMAGAMAPPPRLESAPPSRGQSTPSELLAAAVVLPPHSRLIGQPLPLLSAVLSTADRRQQLEMIHSYWGLVEAVVVYHFCLDYESQLEQVQTQPDEAATIRMARTSAAAMLREAEVTAAAAQHDLAALLRFPPDAPLPLPADRPHVGQYRTALSELFPGGMAPPQARMIDRTLPLRHQAIEERAAAIQAADEALKTISQAHAAGRAGIADVLTCARECLKQRQAWIISVCRYNHDIAEYATTVASPGTSPQALLAMLIRPSQTSANPPAPAMDVGVRPTGLLAPMPNSGQRPGRNQPTPARPRGLPSENTPTPATGWSAAGSAGANEPTLAPPQPSAGKNEPTLAPPQPPPPTGKNEPTLAPPQPQEQAAPEKNEPTLAPPQKVPEPNKSSLPKRPIVPVEPQAEEPTPRTANKPVIGESLPATTSALYPALSNAEPAVQAKQLATALHWDRSLPKGIGEPISLQDCLLGRPAAERRIVVAAYWLVRQRAGEYQALADEVQWLRELTPPSPESGNSVAVCRLRAASRSAEAALDEAHVALIEAQLDLAEPIGRAADAIWPLPAGVPHAGAFLLRPAAESAQALQSWPLRRLEAVIPGLGETLQRQAAAVVEADAARAALSECCQPDRRPIEPVLAAIDCQTAETLSFLQTLTAYNRAIADYVLTVSPAEAPAKLAELVGRGQ